MDKCQNCNGPCEFMLCDFCNKEEELKDQAEREYYEDQDEKARKALTKDQYDKYLEGEYENIIF